MGETFLSSFRFEVGGNISLLEKGWEKSGQGRLALMPLEMYPDPSDVKLRLPLLHQSQASVTSRDQGLRSRV